MIALDTSVVVRVVTRDDARQAARAAELMRSGPLFLAKSVLLEIEWVLRFTYGFEPSAIHDAFALLLGLTALTAEDAPAVAQALTWYAAGLDFADALHLASSRDEVTGFATFDRRLARRAAEVDGAVDVRLLDAAGRSRR